MVWDVQPVTHTVREVTREITKDEHPSQRVGRHHAEEGSARETRVPVRERGVLLLLVRTLFLFSSSLCLPREECDGQQRITNCSKYRAKETCLPNGAAAGGYTETTEFCLVCVRSAKKGVPSERGVRHMSLCAHAHGEQDSMCNRRTVSHLFVKLPETSKQCLRRALHFRSSTRGQETELIPTPM